MSAIEKLEKRVAELETEVAELKKRRTPAEHAPTPTAHAWLDAIFGSFANDPEYLEAMRLGRQYRESTRPKSRKAKKKKVSHVDS